MELDSSQRPGLTEKLLISRMGWGKAWLGEIRARAYGRELRDRWEITSLGSRGRSRKGGEKRPNPMNDSGRGPISAWHELEAEKGVSRLERGID